MASFHRWLIPLGLCGVLIATSGCSVNDAPSPSVPGMSSSPGVPERWHPTQPIEHRPLLSEAEKLRLRADFLAREERFYLKEIAALEGRKVGKRERLPATDLVRWTTMADHSKMVARCLTDNGFQARVTEDDAIDYLDGIKESQQTAFWPVYFECISRYSMDPTYLQEWTPAQWGLLYDYWTEFFVPCAEQVGRTFSDPPTRDTFIAKRGADWEPIAETDLAGLAERCPPRPDPKDFYG